MKLIPQRLTILVGAATLVVAFGCQRQAQQTPESGTEASDQTATTEPSAAADATVEQQPVTSDAEGTGGLAEREDEIARREAAVARRESALSGRAKSAAPAPTGVPSEPEPAQPTTAGDESWRERPAEREVAMSVPAGTTFDIEMIDGVSSETAQVGDQFSARTVYDLTDGEQVAVPAGSRVEGEVSTVQSLKKIGGQAQLGLRFNRIVLPEGTSYPLEASFAAAGKSETKRDTGAIAGGAAAGAILGRIIDKRHRDKGTVLGALVGAAVGTVIASKTEGEAVELPAGSVVTLSLDQSLSVSRRVPIN